jgi:hypothetical protein
VTYTRGEQVLKPTEVEYLFTNAADGLQRVENQLHSLALHFEDAKPEVANELQIALSNVIIARAKTNVQKRTAVNHVMPHRQNAGEHEHW